jgi:serine/threonine protein kinase
MPPYAPPSRLGRFEVVRPLAAGGMARIYLGRDRLRLVALKVLPPGDDAVALRDEWRVISQLRHPHVCEVIEAGVAHDGTSFLAMEYVHGASLKDVLESARRVGRRLPLELGMSVVLAAARGLHHAHEHGALGIVHRDVSPSNVMIGHDGAVKLIDFGIAWSTGRETAETRKGLVKGKAGYMAPEQLLGGRVDRRCDVFSLGVVLYEVTAQARAFRAGSDHETARRVMRGEVRPPAAARPGYPADLAQVVMNSLAVDLGARYQTAGEFAEAIDRCAARLGLTLGAPPIAGEMRTLYPDAHARRARGTGAIPAMRVGNPDPPPEPPPDPPSDPDDATTTARFVQITE